MKTKGKTLSKLIKYTTSAHLLDTESNSGGERQILDLGFRSEYPLEVRMRFRSVTGYTQTWTVSRDVLNDGTMRDAGDGFVLVTPVDDNESVSITLVGETHAAELYLNKDTLLRFLTETYERVPAGSEGGTVSAALDNELDNILKGN